MKLYRPFTWDKANHALYGAAIYIITRLMSLVLLPDLFTPITALLMAVMAGIGLEVYQKKTNSGTPDWKDAFAVIILAFALGVVELIFHWI